MGWVRIGLVRIGLVASGWALTLFGNVPNVAQPDQALLGIRLSYGVVPATGLILMLLIWFPITKTRHGELVAQLEERTGE